MAGSPPRVKRQITQNLEEALESARTGEHHEEGTLKYHVASILHSKVLESIVVLLIFLDIGLLCVEAGIDHHVICINGRVVSNTTNAVKPVAAWLDKLNLQLEHELESSHPMINEHELGSSQQGSGAGLASLRHNRGQGFKIVPDSYHTRASAVQITSPHDPHGHSRGHSKEVLMCDTRRGPRANAIAHKCHAASIAILCFFLLEISLKCWLDPEKFYKNWFTVIDATVVVVSLLVDTVVIWIVQSFSSGHTWQLTLIVAALLFVRMWRIIRIVHGLLGYMHEKQQQQEEVVEEVAAVARRASVQLDALNEYCDSHGVDVPEHLRSFRGGPPYTAR